MPLLLQNVVRLFRVVYRQAAQALAKRLENIDRCFIGVSPGGVGQSLYSAHLEAVYQHNHAFFDPNVWYHDDELRKQAGSAALTYLLRASQGFTSAKIHSTRFF